MTKIFLHDFDCVFLFPQSLGIDKTTVVYVNVTENGNGESRTDLPKDPTIVAKCALIIISIYLFYLLNNIMNFCQVTKRTFSSCNRIS